MKKVSQSNFKTYHNHRAEPYFTFVKNGQKTIEGRIKKGWYRFVKPGDHIIVYNEEETDCVEVLVKGVRTYASIRKMLEQESIKKLLPNIETVGQGIEIYKQFYTDEQQDEFGVVAIEVEIIKV
jgi:ASC-1-like (ASCH) protein